MQFLEDLVGPPAYSSSSPQLISDQWVNQITENLRYYGYCYSVSVDGLLFYMILKAHLLKFDIFSVFFPWSVN